MMSVPGAPIFKQLRQYHSDLDELKRQVNQFEQNVADAIAQLANVFAQPRLRPTNRKTANYAAQLLDMVIADSSLGNMTLTLPQPTQQLRGLPVGIVRLSASNTITVLSPGALVNGSASATLATTTKLYLLYSDGVNWWSL